MFTRRLLYAVGWRLVERLTPGQIELIRRLLTPGQQRYIERLLTSRHVSGGRRPIVRNGKPSALVDRLALRLWNLGFCERALADLHRLAQDDSRPRLQRQAAWELCAWYADQYSEEGAHRCLDLLSTARRGEDSPVRLRRAAVLEAESLDAVGAREEAKRALSRAMRLGPNADLYLAAANLESSLPDRITWLNKALALHRLSLVVLDDSTALPPLHRLRSVHSARRSKTESGTGPRVTVIMPAYNAEGSIQMALDSILAQTWANLEVVVVDDCSQDATAALVEKYEEQDSRVRLIRSESNRGTYVARNLGLQAATGEFITCHDADDWAHPQRIERQAVHLMDSPSVVANTSQLARVTPGPRFYRRGNPGFYIQVNMASFMFRRQSAVDSLGYWDSVRFAGDGEFIERARRVFGNKAVKHLTTGPLALAVQSDACLTAHDAFGYYGRLAGARKEYRESYTHFHPIANDLRFEFPQHTRPFPAPEPMWPEREVKRGAHRHFEVILASDFRLPGGSTLSNMEEIKAQRATGLRTGLLQMPRYDVGLQRPINPRVRELIDGDRVQILVYGEEVSCDLLVLRHPPVLQERQRYLPDVDAGQVIVIVNQTPYADYGPGGRQLYDIRCCVEHLRGYFGQAGTWYTIGPLVRETLFRHHAADIAAISLADEHWVNIIDVNEWRRASRPSRGRTTRIGRHSRDEWRKWPADREESLAIYPDSAEYEVHVLGGADAPRQVLGRLPKNWRVLDFGAMHPKDFLATLDVFVYYTHPYWVESFGRVILEAMAVGVPAILPPVYRQLFQEAAVYAEPGEVREAIDRLMNDDEYYQSRVERAWAYVERNFGYSKHAARIDQFLAPENAQG